MTVNKSQVTSVFWICEDVHYSLLKHQYYNRMNYSKYLSKVAARRKPSGISDMRKYLVNPSPSLVWLGSGMPNPTQFPFREVTVGLNDGEVLHISQDMLSSGLQYGPTPGYAPLVTQLKAMVERHHSPPRWSESNLLVTVGAQDGVSKAFEMLLDPGDYVVISDPCYSDALCMLASLAPQYLAIENDDEGMVPANLRAALKLAANSEEKRMPKALYLVPNASNPTGTTMGEVRRREIYAIAQEYDLIILEDDPYYFLTYEEEQNIPPSFLSLDIDGRVLRFDSFSKIVSAGLRVAFVTGPAPLLAVMELHLQSSVICGPMFSQVLVSELLREWGEEGFSRHTAKLRIFYKNQRDAMLLAASTHLTGLCEWTVPKGGIFLWLKVVGVKDTGPMIIERGITKNVILIPGKEFVVDSSKPNQFMRAAFSCVTPEQMMKGMENLASLIREEIALQNNQA
ncbi:hypothetical protein Pmani_033929 [Petrolisthes manimaculis]|uniref:Aminotransferase class I/classII large domain-containing protein n=1 Tax=Petrolisthes manimaculis TaxID=1843537 RepID=A0AAE1NPY7_9EUCA|nr:hypothetical protein Pmani_033929 [Petrolisthes manimaculis]